MPAKAQRKSFGWMQHAPGAAKKKGLPEKKSQPKFSPSKKRS